MGGAFAALAIVFAPSWAAAQEVRVVYDQKGQVVATIDVDGSAAVLTWDLNGNLLGVVRVPPGNPADAVGISLVIPNAGVAGDTVEIFGKGFGATPAANTVTFFDGRLATVLEAAPNALRVTVPPSVATGRIHVQVGANGADSPTPFTVPGALTITPTTASVLPGRTQQFTASGPAVWSVDGRVAGSPQVGTITDNGLYRAPLLGPFPRTVTVAASKPGRPQERAEATVTVLPPNLLEAQRLFVGPSSPPLTRADRLTAPRLFVTPTLTVPNQLNPLTAARLFLTPQPVITAVDPPQVALGSTDVQITLTGQGFTDPTALQFLFNGNPDGAITLVEDSLTALSDTQATARINVGTAAQPGGHTVQLTAGAGTSTPAGHTSNVLQVTP